MYFDSTLVGSIIGLSLVLIGWILQLISSWNGKKALRKRFVIFYNLGVAVLIIDGFMQGNNLIAVLNIIIFIIASIVLSKIGEGDVVKKKRR